MKTLRRDQGFTLLEMMIVVVVIGIAVAIAVPNFTRYRQREQAREGATLVARVLKEARARAIKTGTQQFVIFNPGAPAPAGTLVRRVQDNDANWTVDSGVDFIEDFGLPSDVDATQVTPYGTGNKPFNGASRAPGDPNAGTLDSLVNGASGFPVPSTTSQTTVGFDSRGIPVDPDDATNWGSGAGAFYFTDGVASVFVVVVGPLGEIRIQALSGAMDDWV